MRYHWAAAALSALFQAGRHQEIMALLALLSYRFWHYHQWGVKALIAMGKRAEALRYAEELAEDRYDASAVAATCEEILLTSGMAAEAYERYAFAANRKGTYLATFRAIAKKYPNLPPEKILADLVRQTPGEEGKWFAAAKAAGLYREAAELARRSPCEPKTLTRAAKDFQDQQPDFAVAAGLAALHWLARGYGYEITGLDVMDACDTALQAAQKADSLPETTASIKNMMAESGADNFVSKLVQRQLVGLSCVAQTKIVY